MTAGTKPEKSATGAAATVVAPATTVNTGASGTTNVTAPGTQVDVMKNGNGQPTATVVAPGTAVNTTGAGSTSVNTPGATVNVAKNGSSQPTTTVRTVAGVDVVNSPQGTLVTGIPVVGTVMAPGGRRMLRAF
jgi:hypothetical protein